VGDATRRSSKKVRSPPAEKARPSPVSTTARSSLGGSVLKDPMASRNASPRATVMAFRFLGEASVTILTVASCESFSTARASRHVHAHVETGVRGIISYGGRGRGPCVQHVPSLLYRERWPMAASSGGVGREKAQPCAVPCAALAHSGRASCEKRRPGDCKLVGGSETFVGATRASDSSHPRVFNTVSKRTTTTPHKSTPATPNTQAPAGGLRSPFSACPRLEISHVLSCLQELSLS